MLQDFNGRVGVEKYTSCSCLNKYRNLPKHLHFLGQMERKKIMAVKFGQHSSIAMHFNASNNFKCILINFNPFEYRPARFSALH